MRGTVHPEAKEAQMSIASVIVNTASLPRALRIARKVVDLMPMGSLFDSETLARDLTDLDVRVTNETMSYVITQLKGEGWIEKTNEYRNARRPEARGRPLRVWRVRG